MDSTGDSLELKCQVHPEMSCKVRTAEDIAGNSPTGGCTKKCSDPQLKCGHTCPLLCHVIDHEFLHCELECLKRCKGNLHPCPAKCWEQCPPCLSVVKYTSLGCGHEAMKNCSDSIKHCTAPCATLLSCGHKCRSLCHAADDPNHTQYNCEEKCISHKGCKNIPPHPCHKLCHEQCSDCLFTIQKQAQCGHYIKIQCSYDMNGYKCKYPCSWVLPCGHSCPLLCSEPCGECRVIVHKKFTDCTHTVEVSIHLLSRFVSLQFMSVCLSHETEIML